MTYHEDVEDGTLQDMARDPVCARVIPQVMLNLKSGFYEQVHVEALRQDRGRWTPGEAWAFAQVVAGIRLGYIAQRRIYLGFDPSPNADVAINRIKLSVLPDLFSADIECKAAEIGDGALRWTDSFEMGTWSGDVESQWMAPPGIAPLEIGSTRAITSWLHLAWEGALARWPYRSQVLWLYALTPLGVQARSDRWNAMWNRLPEIYGVEA